MPIQNSLLAVPFALTLGDSPGRVGTGFICTVPFDEPADGDNSYVHAYATTALHCVMDMASLQLRKVAVEFRWMGSQGGARVDLGNDEWTFMSPGDLPDGEDWVDLAVIPMSRGYTGIVIGRALGAISIDRFIAEDAEWNMQIGSPVATIGLFNFYSGTERALESIARFGKIAMLPDHPVRGANDRSMRTYFVESHAAEGMSGAPVFLDENERDPSLLGVHIGHAPSFNGTSKIGDSQLSHSGVALVAPAYLLRRLLNSEHLVEKRRETEEECSRAPWKFLDRRHRERRGVAFKEETFADEHDYLDEHPKVFAYLFLKPGPQASFVKHESDSWNLSNPQAFCGAEHVQALFGVAAVRLRWATKLFRLCGWGSWIWPEGKVEEFGVNVYLTDEDEVHDVSAIRFEFESPANLLQLRALAAELGATRIVDTHQDVAYSVS